MKNERTKPQTIDCFIADARHNRLRLNPLTEEYIGISEPAIRSFEQKVIDDSERQVRMHGKFRYLSGRVWKSWDRFVHTIDRNKWVAGEKGVIINGQPPKQWERTFIMDPHDEKPHALLWVAKEPNYGHYFCYKEAWLKDKTFKQVCEYIRNSEVNDHERILYRIMDPNFGPKKQGNTKTTVRDDFETESRNIGFPMRFMFGDDHVSLGHKKISEMLWYDVNKPITLINTPTLFICGDLAQCIYQIEHYVWPDRDDTKPDPTIEKPIHKHDDFPACLRYLSLFKWMKEPAEIIPGWGNAY